MYDKAVASESRGGGWCFDYYLPWNSQPPPAGGSKSKEGFCKSKEGWDPSFHLHYLFTSSPDYTPPLIIIKHPSFHLQLPLRVPTLTCIIFCIIPRLYPTAHHYKTSLLSLATVDRPPLLGVFIIKHNKSPTISCNHVFMVAIMSSWFSLLTIVQAVLYSTASCNGASWTSLFIIVIDTMNAIG